MFCSNCGKEIDAGSSFCSNCGTKLVMDSFSKPMTLNNNTVVYAGFWKRFAAFIIDYILVWVAGFIVGFIIGALFFDEDSGSEFEVFFTLLGIITYWLYWSLMESSPKQATLGKMALGIIVTDAAGNRVSFGRATGRLFAKIISALILFIGFIMIAFTEKKEGLHDMMAETLVVLR